MKIHTDALRTIDQNALLKYKKNNTRLIRQYGFAADTTKTKRQNILAVLTSQLFDEYQRRPTKLAFHDLTKNTSIPRTTKILLGLGTKFCIADEKPTYNWVKTAQKRLTHQIRLHAELCLLYTSPSPRDATLSRMPSSA